MESFFSISNPALFHPLPESWLIAVSDIQNSTAAIGRGEYKYVNILGASPIVGLLNKQNKNQIPYTFGGDGSVVCIPPDMQQQARAVLATCRIVGRKEYDLNLRAALIPVKQIREAGYDVQVARYRVSEVYDQAVFRGNGLNYAEELLKSDTAHSEEYLVDTGPSASPAGTVDFTGLECRWQEVGKRDRTVITVLVAPNPDREDHEEINRNLLQKLHKLFGFDENTNPVDPSHLSMSMSLSSLLGEIKFRTFGMNWWQRLKYILKMEMEIITGKLFMALGYESSKTNWSLYKPDLARHSDHRKYDDMVRLVLSGTPRQLEQLEEYLETEFKAGKLAYGLHVSDTAMITCMVFKYQREHMHFVDGSQGGYVEAAKQLKRRKEKLGMVLDNT